jgi:DNA polymerase III epsilon subunit-like protein
MTTIEYAGDRIGTVGEQRQAAVRWARRALSNESVLILGMETSRPGGGFLVEIALIDPTGRIRMNSLVNPRTPIDPAAARRHKLTDPVVAGAPTFGQILPELIQLTTGCVIATYNGANVYEVVQDEAHRAARDPEHLEDPTSWRSIAQLRSHWLGRPDHYLPLPPSERAIGQCHACLGVLQDIAVD